MNQKDFDTIIKYANKLCPNVRKPKYSNEYYLTNILNVLTDFVSWKSLKKSIDINKDHDFHYKSIARKHKLWSDKGVYKQAFNETVKSKKIFYDVDDVIIKCIDSTLIINKSGIECIGYGSETRKKKFTKLSALCDINGNCDAIIHHTTTKKEIKKTFNKQTKKANKLTKASIRKIINNFKKEVTKKTTKKNIKHGQKRLKRSKNKSKNQK